MADSTQLFSDRVENYVRYRPGYPPALVASLQQRARLDRQSAVADIGSGTGIFTALLLPVARRVYAVEPNPEMRAAAEAQFEAAPGFVSVAAPAEATTLPAAAVNLVTVAQAFHWFDHRACRREFNRILQPGGKVALIWNERQTGATPFLADYEQLLKTRVPRYDQKQHSRIGETAIREFFAPDGFEKIEAPNNQHFDLSALHGRALSSSYIPNVGQPGHAAFVADLERLFHRHAQHGTISFTYVTRLYLGRLS